jgi:outer membrane protein assembly factor BamB
MRRFAWAGGLFLGLVLSVAPLRAVVTAPTPLASILSDKQYRYIVVAKIEAIDADKLTMILTVEEHLKGKAPFTRLPVNLKSREKTAKEQTPVLMKRLGVKLPVVLFLKDLEDGDYTAFVYTNGTWFMMIGKTPEGADGPRWLFTELEPYLRRTFKGATAEMRQVVIDGLSGKKAPPPWDEKEKPGVGPEVKPEEKEEDDASFRREPESASPQRQARAGDTPLLGAAGSPNAHAFVVVAPTFAVIPSVIIGGPLAILAMIFPAWFGGWRRWLALIGALCTASTVVFVYWMWGHRFATSVWGSDLAQWLMITAIVILSAAWAWQRHVRRLRTGEAPPVPSRAEFVVLAVLALVAFGTLGVCWKLDVKLTSPSWLLLAPMGIAAVVGMAFVALARRGPRQETPWEELDLWTPAAPSGNGDAFSPHAASSGGTAVAVVERPVVATASAPAPSGAPALATEVVMLTVMAVACTALAGTLGPRTVSPGPVKARGELFPVKGGEKTWMFRPDLGGLIASSPLVVGDRVYIGGNLGAQGVVLCLDRTTGKPIWDTRKTLKWMKHISISSPVVVDGKLYIGEGFHQDSNCKVYCINADTGKEVWNFPTGSHTESSPFVTGGKVYIGAGDDGLYCLDAKTGDELWHYNGLHIDANPLVHEKRLYVGAGEGDVRTETAILCLDAENGKEIWKRDLDLPAWGSPVLAGDLVFFGIGNGRFDASDKDRPAGAVLCVKASDGATVWRFDTKDGVLCRPSVDRSRVWCGCRDGNLYCLDRRTGKLHWKRELGSPVVTAAAVVRCAPGELANAVYALGSEGQVYCLEPNTGAVYWEHDLTDGGRLVVTLWSSPSLTTAGAGSDGERRQLIFGATLGTIEAPSPAVFCFEDRLTGASDEVIVESRP